MVMLLLVEIQKSFKYIVFPGVVIDCLTPNVFLQIFFVITAHSSQMKTSSRRCNSLVLGIELYMITSTEINLTVLKGLLS
jgi:hypothetical protein